MSVHFDREIHKLKRQVSGLSGVVEQNVRKAVHAVETRDARLAIEVIESDADVDAMEVTIEEECLKILALYQPVAVDLRYIVAVLKINNDLERIGDLAVNIAKRARDLADAPRVNTPPALTEMAEKTRAMLRRSLDALLEMDPAAAHAVLAADAAVDTLNRHIRSEIEEDIQQRPSHLPALLKLSRIPRHLERIADLATNIAEDVIYMTEGAIVRHGH